MVKPWIGIPTHFWFIPATTRCERRHVKPLPHVTHRCTHGLGGQIGGRHHREISSLGFSRMEITTGNSCWIKWACQFMVSELGWTPLCFNPAGHHKKRYMDVYLSIYYIWVNYSESLTWKVRLYCEDSPNPNHDSSEVTVRSLSFPQISLLSQIPKNETCINTPDRWVGFHCAIVNGFKACLIYGETTYLNIRRAWFVPSTKKVQPVPGCFRTREVRSDLKSCYSGENSLQLSCSCMKEGHLIIFDSWCDETSSMACLNSADSNRRVYPIWLLSLSLSRYMYIYIIYGNYI